MTYRAQVHHYHEIALLLCLIQCLAGTAASKLKAVMTLETKRLSDAALLCDLCEISDVTVRNQTQEQKHWSSKNKSINK